MSLFIRNVFVAACLLLVSTSTSFAQEFRTWEDSTGKFKIEAKFVSEKDGVVTLKQKDGSELEIKISLLSTKDQTYVKTTKAGANPFQKKDDNPFMKKDDSSSGGGSGKIVDDDIKNATDMGQNVPVPEKWTVKVTPVQMVKQTKPLNIRLPNKDNFWEKSGNMVTTPTKSHAVIGRTLDRKNENKQYTTVLLVELEKGRYAGKGTTEGIWAPVDIHSSGKQILMRSNTFGREGRTELQLLELGKDGLETVVKWQPYAKSDKGKEVKLAKFVGKDQIMTFGSNEQLVFWSYPEVKPIARIKLNWSATPTTTPNRDYVVYHSDGATGFIEVATHKIVCSLDTPGLHSAMLSVSPSGKRLAALVHNRIKIWDIETSEQYRDFPLNGITTWNKTPVWPDDNHLLVGGADVVDLENRVQLWTYKNADKAAGGEGFVWFYITHFGNRRPGLVGMEIPHDQAKSAIQTALSSGDYFLLKPGSSLKVDASGISDGSKAQEAKATIERRLQETGFKISNSAEVTVTLSTGRGKTQELSYRSFGSIRGDKYSFTPFFSKMEFMYNGKSAWTRSSTGGVPFMLHLKKDQTIADAIKSYEVPNYKFFDGAEIPKYVPKPRSDGKYTLGTTDLVIR